MSQPATKAPSVKDASGVVEIRERIISMLISNSPNNIAVQAIEDTLRVAKRLEDYILDQEGL